MQLRRPDTALRIPTGPAGPRFDGFYRSFYAWRFS